MPFLAFFSTALGRQVGLALAVLSLVAGFYSLARHQGAESIRKADAKATEAARTHVATVEAKAQQITTDASNAFDQRRVQIHTQTASVLQRVHHVPASDPSFYPVSLGFVRLYDASLGLSDVSGSAGNPDDAPSGLGSADALPTIIGNNGACREDQARLSALQSWIRAQASNH